VNGNLAIGYHLPVTNNQWFGKSAWGRLAALTTLSLSKGYNLPMYEGPIITNFNFQFLPIWD
jgi:hypothetical protein